MKKLFSGVTLVTMTGEGVLQNAFLGVDGEKITYVGAARPEGYGDAEIIDGRGRALLPGLVNMHTHIPMTVLRGYADDHNLQDWLYHYIFPAEDKLDARCVRAAALLGMAEAVAGGTTAINDMYFFCAEIAEAAISAGLKINLCRPLQNFGGDFDFTTDHRAAELRALHAQYHMADRGLVRVDAGIHAEYTSDPSVWLAAAEFAQEKGIGIHLHLSETRKEHEECVRKYGRTPAKLFEENGVFASPVTAAHCVHVTEADIEILASHGVTAIHNPTSNLKLASGFAPVRDMQKKGVRVTLGTDGSASNNSLDMLEEIKTASVLAKAASGDPTALPAPEALEMATVRAAAALRRQDETGALRPGLDADLVMLRLDRPGLFPLHSTVSDIVYTANGGDVEMTLIRGKTVYDRGTFPTIDIEKVRFELREYVMPHLFGI